MKKNYMIAVCDILGFSDLVNKTSLDQVVNNILGDFRRYLDFSIHKGEFTKSVPTLQELTNHDLIGFAWFSDTVLLYTRDDTDKHCQSLTQTVAALITSTIFASKIRIRAGIAYGEAYIEPENHLYIGKTMIDAYRLEQTQNWIGGAFTESAKNRIPEYAREGKSFDWCLVPYDIPLKERSHHPPCSLAVNWTECTHDKFSLPFSSELSEPTDADWESIPDICWKWKNTMDFHKDVCQECTQKNIRFVSDRS